MKTQKYAGVLLPFTIGDWVEVYKESIMSSNGKQREVDVNILKEPKVGQISKVVTKFIGAIIHSDGYAPYFVPKEKLVFYEVSYSLMNKVVLVQPNDLKIVEEHPARLPLQLGSKWTEEEKKANREYREKHPEDFPRDEKGRFV